MSLSLKLLGHPANHLEGLVTLVAVLMFLAGIYQCSLTFDYIIHMNLKHIS